MNGEDAMKYQPEGSLRTWVLKNPDERLALDVIQAKPGTSPGPQQRFWRPVE